MMENVETAQLEALLREKHNICHLKYLVLTPYSNCCSFRNLRKDSTTYFEINFL